MSDQNNPNKEANKIKIEIDEVTAEGVYTNLAIVNHSHTEFVLDFINVMPGSPKSKVKSRLILTPQHAKKLMRTLQDNIAHFERINGEIADFEKQQVIPLNFGGPEGQA